MTKQKLSKSETESIIHKTLTSNPSPTQIKKLKTLAMSKNIKLKEFKKLFCKNCLTLFNSQNSEIRIKHNHKIIKCKKCRFISRYKLF